MNVSIIRSLFLTSIASAFVCLASLTYFAVTSPIALQKILSMRVSSEEQTFSNLDYNLSEKSDSEFLISQIPYRDDVHDIWNVRPFDKYQSTILNGNGNCSNFAFGAMYRFINQNSQAYIAHLLNKDMSFLEGKGHTVVELVTEDGKVIFDLHEGGMPKINGNAINTDLTDLKRTDEFSHHSFNSRKDNVNEYFNFQYLEKIEFGLIPQKEISEYFIFLDFIYVELGSPFAEKLLYDTLALFTGKYPNTYISIELFEALIERRSIDYIVANSAYYSFHLSYIILILFFLVSAIRALRPYVHGLRAHSKSSH